MLADQMDKEATITLRLTVDEQKAWKAAAELEQMPLSLWIRRRCNGLAAAAPVMGKPKKGRRS